MQLIVCGILRGVRPFKAAQPAVKRGSEERVTETVSTAKKRKKYTLFTGKQLLWLILPIVVESIFSTSLGMVDSMMVSSINDNAGNAVGNVDDINNLIIQLFSAFATGGVIITSQYLGAKKIEEANKSAKHVVVIVFLASMVICILSLILNYPLLKLFFGGVSDEVFEYQRQYFYLTAASFPFIGLFNVCAALLRAQRKSMVTMTSAGLSLVVNVALNAIFIYVLHWEVLGAALATLISRIVPSVYVMFLITRKKFIVHINIFEKFRFDGKMVRHILLIAIPSGIESCLFQLGKLMTSTFVNASCYNTPLADGGTVNYEANANTMAKSLNNMASVVGSGVNNSCLTVVGQSIGTGDVDQTKYYIKKMFLIAFIANACAVGFIMGISNWVVHNMYGYSDIAKDYAMECLYLCLSFQFITYPLSFTSPAVLKATSDVRYVMFCAVGSMIVVRVGLCWVLTSEIFGLNDTFVGGAFGYWIAMCADWCVRSVLFMTRLFTGRWKKASGLLPEDIADRIKGVTKQKLQRGKKLTYAPYSRKGKNTFRVK